MQASVAVVGMRAGGREHVVAHVATGDPVLVVPEPDNPHDPNALAVHTTPASALRDSQWTEHGWALGPEDRRTMMDRQAGYVPAKLAARLQLPVDGLTGEVGTVRYDPDTGTPAGFDVVADWPRPGRARPSSYRPPLDDPGYGYYS